MNASEPARIVVAGGGTGGHVYPGIAIYEALLDHVPTLEAMFVGVRGGMEEKILAAHGLPHTLISGRGLRGAGLATKLAAPLELMRSVFSAATVIRRARPQVVIGTGGFASAAVVIAAILHRIPVVLQEQNSVPGLVNRRLARFATLILLSYAESKRYLPRHAPSSVVGNPLRVTAHHARQTREEAREYFGLDAARRTVLVIGGSRGAHSLNVAGAGAAAILAPVHDVQFIILTGDADYENVRTSLGDIADRVKVLRYLDDIHLAYAAADIAVARAGASSVFELAAWGIPAVLVPYPYAADDHQARNAAPLADAGAAVVVSDGEIDAERLAHEIAALLEHDELRGRMSAAMTAWSRPDAARAAAALVVDILKKKTVGDGPTVNRPRSRRRATLEVVRR